MLEELNDIFMEVKDEEIGYENLPDGEYLATLVSAEYKMSKNDKPMVQFQFKITDGDYKDKVHNKFMMLSGSDETNLKRNLTRYGNEIKKYNIKATSIQDSFDKIAKLKNIDVKLTLKTTDTGFTNTSVEII